MEKLMKKGKSGFTLVELVIVIAILAIVAAIAIPTAANVIGNANKAADNSNAQAIEMALKTYHAENAASSTNTSALADKANALTDKTVKNLLNIYGVPVDLVTLRQSSFHYFYDPTSGKVIAASSAAGQIQITTTCTFELDSAGSLVIKEP